MNLSVFSLSYMNSFSYSPVFTHKHVCFFHNSLFSRSFGPVLDSLKSSSFQRCVFHNFLSNVFISRDNIEYREFMSKSNQQVFFCESVFSDIRSQSSIGGAINCMNCNLNINRCQFKNCHASIQAGGFYINGNTLSLNQTCFYICSSTKLDQYGGNAFLCIGCDAIIKENSGFYSSNSKESGGDSLYDVSNGKGIVSYWNSTECHGQMGSSGGCFRSVPSGSYFNFSYINNCSDYDSFEAWTSTIYCYMNIYLNNNRNTNVFIWGTSNPSCVIDKCTFYNNLRVLESPSMSFTLVNCISDYSYAGISVSSNINTNAQSTIVFCRDNSFIKCPQITCAKQGLFRIPIIALSHFYLVK